MYNLGGPLGGSAMRYSTSIFWGVFAAMAVLSAVIYEDFNQASSFSLAQRTQVHDHISADRAKLEAILNERLHHVHGLGAFAKFNPTFSEADFQIFAAELADQFQDIRSLQLAPDAIVTHIYPPKGNEAALGHDLLADPARREAAQRAIAEHKFVIAGPHTLKQGGVALIGRYPIYLSSANGAADAEKFWGFAIILIDFEPLLKKADIIGDPREMQYALRGKDGLGASGEVFFGNPELFNLDPVILNISLPNGSWQLAGLPKKGWATGWPGQNWLRGVGGGLALLVGFLIYAVLRRTDELNAEITERKKSEDELIKARSEAEKANLAKSEFLASMSHELRTPLNAILGFAQILELSPKEPLTDKQKEATCQIINGGKHLLNLINDVLDLARIEVGHMDLEIGPVKTKDMLDECLPIIDNLTYKFGVTIVTDNFTGAVVQADPVRLKQVLFNLMSNAVKYNRKDGKVFITSSITDDAMQRIFITDTGHGIPQELQSKLFSPFCRLGAENSNIEGTGIGLTICQHLIEEMSGHIGVESTQGVGSTFWIELPLDQHYKEEPHTTLIADMEQTDFAEIKGYILYIEDNSENANLMKAALNTMDEVKLEIVGDAEMGITTAIQTKPDLILMDIRLPGMNGIEALKELRRHDETRTIPVIAITSNAMPSQVKNGLEAGFLAYLTKPFNVAELINMVSDVLSIERDAP